MKNLAIILAGGSGSRLKNNVPKQFIYLEGRRIIDYSIEVFKKCKEIHDIIIVCHKEWLINIKDEYPCFKVVEAGANRQESAYIGLASCPQNTLNVLIHDAARPFVNTKNITQSIELLKQYEAINISTLVTDTIIIAENDIIESIPNREKIYQSQTPQSFRFKTILAAHEKFKGLNLTDDIQLVKNLKIDCYNLVGYKENFKITFEQDFELCKLILKNKKKENI